MSDRHDKLTIISMAVVTAALASALHEGVGHGMVAWMRGDIPTELTSNHLSSVRPDKWVDAGGTLVNLFVGTLALAASMRVGNRANLRYFLWLLGAHNLLPGAGYFVLSGMAAFGDWWEIIQDLPQVVLLRVGMATFGVVLYGFVAWRIAIGIRPFVPTYNVVGRLPYLAAGLFSCVAGAFDPLGLKLMLISTIPAAFGGSSGMLWLDNLMPRKKVETQLVVHRQVAWWIVAAVVGTLFIAIMGRGISFAH
jgi:hypothetical protein